MQTRYYDSNTGRFISSDGYVSTGQGILGCNMYAYCNNNPVMYADYSGEFSGVLSLAGLATAALLLTITALVYDATHEKKIAEAAENVIGAITDTVNNIAESIKSLADSKEETATAPPPTSFTYYHITTAESALSIMNSGVMTGSPLEGGYVFAWKTYPDKKAITKNLGLMAM